MFKALSALPPWLRPLLWLGAVGVVLALVGGALGTALWKWFKGWIGLESEEEEGDNGEESDNGDDADPEDGLTGGRPGDPNGDGGGQVPFDRNLEDLGRDSLAQDRLKQEAASAALRRSQSR